MPSPRNSPRSIRERRAYGSRLEFLSLPDQRGPISPENMSHPKDSPTSTGPQQALPEEDCMKLNPSFWGIALHSLLAVDLWASKLLGICAGENSPWGSVRPLMMVIEVSGHGIPWLTGTLYGLYRSGTSAGREVLLNLLFEWEDDQPFADVAIAIENQLTDSECLRAYEEWEDDQPFVEFTYPQGAQHDKSPPQPCTSYTTRMLLGALILDLVLVAAVKGLVKRRRPVYNKMDMFATVSVDKYSFPSGHATRAAMVCRFILHHLVLAIPLRVLVVLWTFIVGISRVMLGRHNVTDVVFGLIMGYMQYSLVEYFWLSPVNAPVFFAFWN